MKENVKRFVLTLKYLKETLAIILSFRYKCVGPVSGIFRIVSDYLLSIKYESAGTTYVRSSPSLFIGSRR